MSSLALEVFGKSLWLRYGEMENPDFSPNI
jgi:hypothetical protein